MSDIEMLEVIFRCDFLMCGCSRCKLLNKEDCREIKMAWFAEYIQKLKNREDDLK